MSYNTNFHIVEKETGVILWVTPHNACFAEFVPIKFDDKKEGFAPGRKMEIIHEVSKMKISEDIVKWWCEYLSKIGFPVTYTIEKRRWFRMSNKYEPHPNPAYPGQQQAVMKDNKPVMEEKTVFDEDCYVWSLDFDEYSSKAQLKIGAYFVRYLYEYNEPKIVEATMEYCNKYPEAEPIEAFTFMHQFIRGGGHDWWYGNILLLPLTLKQITLLINKWREVHYNNNERSEVVGFAYIPSLGAYNAPKVDTLTKDSPWEDYKKMVSDYLAKHNIKQEEVDDPEEEEDEDYDEEFEEVEEDEE